jgi:hypothetical protein
MTSQQLNDLATQGYIGENPKASPVTESQDVAARRPPLKIGDVVYLLSNFADWQNAQNVATQNIGKGTDKTSLPGPEAMNVYWIGQDGIHCVWQDKKAVFVGEVLGLEFESRIGGIVIKRIWLPDGTFRMLTEIKLYESPIPKQPVIDFEAQRQEELRTQILQQQVDAGHGKNWHDIDNRP